MTTAQRAGLRQFQTAFAQALTAGSGSMAGEHEAGGPLAGITSQPGFAVYRNTVLKACIDALGANFPAVKALSGTPWFEAAARVHVGQSPPDHPVLLDYGVAFPAFLRAFAPASGWPWLADVAQLERYWSESHEAPDAAAMAADALALLAPGQLAAEVLRPHPSARWLWHDDAPIATLWQRNTDRLAASAHDDPPDWHGEGLLLVRATDSVRALQLTRGQCAFLDACAAQAPLGEAAMRALAVQPDCDLAQTLAQLLGAGAFEARNCSHPDGSHPDAPSGPQPDFPHRPETT